MRGYVGQTRSRSLIARLVAYRIGECTVRGQLPARRNPWFYDNGAFADWKAGKGFDEVTFTADLTRIRDGFLRPDFIVLPDLVTQGSQSLDHSMNWLARCRAVAPCYLAVQDGMTLREVASVIPWVQGLFVGGSKEWKQWTGRQWCQLAHQNGRGCHIGRVGSVKQVKWAARCGADSVDSNAPLFTEDQLRRFVSALDFVRRQGCMASAMEAV